MWRLPFSVAGKLIPGINGILLDTGFSSRNEDYMLQNLKIDPGSLVTG